MLSYCLAVAAYHRLARIGNKGKDFPAPPSVHVIDGANFLMATKSTDKTVPTEETLTNLAGAKIETGQTVARRTQVLR